MTAFQNLVANYLEAKSVWEAEFDLDCEKASTSPNWTRYQLLTDEIIEFRCETMEDLKDKCSRILSDLNIFENVHNCFQAADGRQISGLTMFLRSIIDTPVDKSKIGEN